MYGATNCILATKLTHKGIKIQLYAYCIYNDYVFNTTIKVVSSCNILNCVKREHLIAYYCPTKGENDYILSYLKIDGHEHLANSYNVPLSLFIAKYPKN